MRKFTVGALALAGIWLVSAPAQAGCGFNPAKAGDAPVIATCSAEDMTQLASAGFGGEGDVSSTVPQGPLYPANNGNGRYICTPSGFGHIATCSLRTSN